MPDSDELIKDSHKNKMVTKFTLMCPGISMSTLTHGLSLHGSQSFEEMCNQLTTTIEYADPPESDVEVSDSKLVRRSNDNGQYWDHTKVGRYFVRLRSGNWYSRQQAFMPNIEMRSDLVGDTEMISTFIDKYKLNVNWVHKWENANLTQDIAVRSFACNSGGLSYSRRNTQCVPPHKHVPWYIWTRYPEEKSDLTL